MKKRVALFTFFTLLQVHASVGDVKTFNIPFENSLPGRSLDGKVNVDISAALIGPAVTDDFYGADNHGFDRMPGTELVSPLKLGHIKLGGNLHSKYNWDLNAYYSNYSDRVEYVY